MQHTLHLNRRHITLILLGIVVLLACMGGAADILSTWPDGHRTPGWTRFFALDDEFTIPTAFAGGMLLSGSAGLLTFITALEWSRRSCDTWRWAVLALGLAAMCIDELASLHEYLIGPVRAFLDLDAMGLLYWAWVLPGILLVIVVALVYARFILRIDPPVRNRFILAAAIYLGGALGLEMLGGRYAELHGPYNSTYHVYTTIEETMEMLGVVILIDGLLLHLQRAYGTIRLVFKGAPVSEPPASD